jgi:hypothetical protein
VTQPASTKPVATATISRATLGVTIAASEGESGTVAVPVRAGQ